MTITILTLFPEMFLGPFDHSIIKRAQQDKKITIKIVNIRNFGIGKHKVVDDKTFGGGVGMTMRVDVLHNAIESVRDSQLATHEEQVILLDARGERFTQKKAKSLSTLQHLIFVCGHYEGVDERIREYVDGIISIGDFINTGGEIPSMLITDAVTRLVSGVLKDDATAYESFSEVYGQQLLEYPQYTLPREYQDKVVPDVLLSGNHTEIAKWRKEQAGMITQKHRPDLLKK